MSPTRLRYTFLAAIAALTVAAVAAGAGAAAKGRYNDNATDGRLLLGLADHEAAPTSAEAGVFGRPWGIDVQGIRACRQGGHVNMFEAATGRRFGSEGECVRHGLRGQPYPSLTLTNTVYSPCVLSGTGTCWGIITGSGLQPGSFVAASLTFDSGGGTTDQFTVDGNGNCCVESGIPWHLDMNCPGGGVDIVASGTTSGGAGIETPDVQTPEQCDNSD